MDITLFVEHLNQVAAVAPEENLIEEIHALLHTHTKNEKPPDANAQLAASIVSALCTVIERHGRERAAREQKRRLDAIKGVINSLSFSELEAAVHICQALGKEEGILVAGHIADKLGFTRSVVVNALRKLEGAGTLETRSLGMKGMYIKIKDELLAQELKKLGKLGNSRVL